MNRIRITFLALPLAGLLGATLAFAEPAEVEVLADEQEDDFFSADKMQAPPVVEVSPNPTPPAAPPAPRPFVPPGAPVAPPSGPAALPAPPMPPPPTALPVRHRRTRCGRARCSWWRKPSHVARGDLMVSFQGGGFSGGGFGGLGFEGMVSDRIGLRLMFRGAGFEGEDIGDRFGNNWNFFDAGRWGISQDITSDNLYDGYAHLLDVDVTFHLFRRSRFDVYTALGVSHFGYSLDLKKETLRGGSGFSRLGAGVNFHWRRLFAGFDLGWYPYELVRYEVFRNEYDDLEAATVDIDDHYNSGRYTAVLRLGIRL